MSRISFLAVIVLAAVLASCNNDHLIKDASYRKAVKNDYKTRYEQFGDACHELFEAVEETDDATHREAAQFLLAYMPLNDIAVYKPGFFLSNVDVALRTRTEMSWGKKVPEDIFLHFVLPQRVNTENIDSFRILYYEELKERVEGLDAEAAALEINHWCHEKVSYQPSDSRTSAPLATILSARGRCGEESTLTVSALRTIGLPARQVYTPRWAHTDDNHAWVEVWIDDNWYYLGACEPEPVLDRGWFTEPARRAMLVHTKAFGRYNGNEQVIKRKNLFAELNVLTKYADTKKLDIKVTDENSNPVPDATIDFLLYNYAELYPIASLISSKDGEASFTTGKGSLVVWASCGGRYGFTLTSPNDEKATVVITDKNKPCSYTFDFEPPGALPEKPAIPDELIRENALRLRAEDSIRQCSIDTWMHDVNVAELAGRTNLEPERIYKVLKTSMGNFREIEEFISLSGEKAELALRLLENISEKDLRDTPYNILADHLDGMVENNAGLEDGVYDSYVLSPRIDNEIITAFRSELRTALSPDILKRLSDGPEAIASWIDTAITVNLTDNYYGTPVTPAGVEKLRVSDPHSRDIFFVALCRTLGYPARIERATGRPQYLRERKWREAWFSDSAKPSDEKGFVTFVSDDTNPVPEYHLHFSLSAFTNGKFRPLDFGDNIKISQLPGEIPLDPGRYMLLTGNRDETGKVLAGASFFDLRSGSRDTLLVTLRKNKREVCDNTSIDMNKELQTVDGKAFRLSDISENGAVLIWIEPDKEPSKHVLKDLQQYKKELDDWGGDIVFFIDPSLTNQTLRPSEIIGLPSKTIFAWDREYTFLHSLASRDGSEFTPPVIMSITRQGDISYSSEGYVIGIGEQILKNIKQ